MKSTATLLGLIGLASPMDIHNNNTPVVTSFNGVGQ